MEKQNLPVSESKEAVKEGSSDIKSEVGVNKFLIIL